MADFVASVPDQEIRRRLERAIEGRGAFRRFEDELLDHPDLREAWFAFADARIAAGESPAQAISRAYYAAFYAAKAALAELGETRSRHSGVVAAFGQSLIRPGMLDATSGRLLRSLFDRRTGADDDETDEPTSDDAQAAIRDGAAVVETVDRWLQGRGSTPA
jgi:uncharacterized protein (UPF0332 family)